MVARNFIVAGLAAFALSSGLTAPAIADDKVTVLKPATPWNVDYGEEKCRLARIFGEGDSRSLLFIEQWGPDAKFGFTVAGPALRRFKGRRPTALVTYDGAAPTSAEPFRGEVEEFGPAIVYASMALVPEPEADSLDKVATQLPQLELEQAARSRFVALEQGGRTVKFMTGPLDQAFEVLNQCSEQRLNEWGLDIEKHRTLTRMPFWTNQQEIVDRIVKTYPQRALRAGESAIARLRVNVNEKGQVTECVTLKATDTNILNSPACRQMQKAEFEPALDSEGKPMASFYQTSIIYRIG